MRSRPSCLARLDQRRGSRPPRGSSVALPVGAQVEQHLRDVAAEVAHRAGGHPVDVPACSAGRRPSRSRRRPCPPPGRCRATASRRPRPGAARPRGPAGSRARGCRGSVTRSALASASCSKVTEPGPSGASGMTAFMPLRWSAATISMSRRRRDRGHPASLERGQFVHQGLLIGGRAASLGGRAGPAWVAGRGGARGGCGPHPASGRAAGGSSRAANSAAPYAVSWLRSETDTSGSTPARARWTLRMPAQPPVSRVERAGGTSRSMASTSRRDLVVAVPQHGVEQLGRADPVGADGQGEDAVVVAGAAHLDGVGREIALQRERERCRVERVATRSVGDAAQLQCPPHQQAGLHPGDERRAARARRGARS